MRVKEIYQEKSKQKNESTNKQTNKNNPSLCRFPMLSFIHIKINVIGFE